MLSSQKTIKKRKRREDNLIGKSNDKGIK